jgi:hypothetical protein
VISRTVSGDRVFDYAAGEFLITQLDLPVVGQVTEASAGRPFLGVGLRIEPAEIAAILPPSSRRPPAAPVTCLPARPASPSPVPASR